MKFARALLVSAAVALGIGPALAETPADTLVIASLLDDIVSLDPAEGWEPSSNEMIANAYEKLVDYDWKDPSKIFGVIAESWTVSPDGLTFTFKIRPGLQFASGNPITAADVAFSYGRAVKLNKGPAFILRQFGFDENNVDERIKQTSDTELVLQIDKPYAPSFVLYCLSSNPVGSIVDSKLVRENEKDGDLGAGWLKTQSAGSGPFIIRDWQANEAAVLEKNPNYAKEQPGVAQVIYRHIPDVATQRLLLEKGDVDVAKSLGAQELEQVGKDPNITLQSTPVPRLYNFGLSQKDPNLSKPQVWEALKYLVDYDGIADTLLKNKAVVHQTFLPAGQLGAITDKPYKLDVERAKALLAEAGLADGFDVSIDVPNRPDPLAIAQAVQKTFGQAGVRLEIKSADEKQVFSRIFARQHQIAWSGWGSDYPDPNSNATAFAANPDNGDDSDVKSPAWRASWEIPELTAAAEKAALETDTEKRKAMYEEMQREVLKSSPFIIMFQPIDTAALRKNVQNYVVTPNFHTYGTVSKN